MRLHVWDRTEIGLKKGLRLKLMKAIATIPGQNFSAGSSQQAETVEAVPTVVVEAEEIATAVPPAADPIPVEPGPPPEPEPELALEPEPAESAEPAEPEPAAPVAEPVAAPVAAPAVSLRFGVWEGQGYRKEWAAFVKAARLRFEDPQRHDDDTLRQFWAGLGRQDAAHLLPDLPAGDQWARPKPASPTRDGESRGGGIVLWFDLSKHFGFIKPGAKMWKRSKNERGMDIFVHQDAVDAAGLETLEKGDEVTFAIGRKDSRDVAVELELTKRAAEIAPAKKALASSQQQPVAAAWPSAQTLPDGVGPGGVVRLNGVLLTTDEKAKLATDVVAAEAAEAAEEAAEAAERAERAARAARAEQAVRAEQVARDQRDQAARLQAAAAAAQIAPGPAPAVASATPELAHSSFDQALAVAACAVAKARLASQPTLAPLDPGWIYIPTTEDTSAMLGQISPVTAGGLFRPLHCPISGARLVDPVMWTADGYSYERAAIEAWLLGGCWWSPVTRQPTPVSRGRRRPIAIKPAGVAAVAFAAVAFAAFSQHIR